jgi:8-oxo-dGTP diphosphatase
MISAQGLGFMSAAFPFVRVGVAVLITRADRLLLIRRQGAHGAGTWSTPGGHLDFGEAPEQGAIREAREEVGLEVADLAFVAITNDLFVAEQRHYITIWFQARQFAGEPTIASPREMTEVGWFGWDALPQPLFLPLANLVSGDSHPPFRVEEDSG